MTLAVKLSTFRETLIVVIGVQLKILMYNFYIIKMYWGDLHIYLVV